MPLGLSGFSFHSHTHTHTHTTCLSSSAPDCPVWAMRGAAAHPIIMSGTDRTRFYHTQRKILWYLFLAETLFQPASIIEFETGSGRSTFRPSNQTLIRCCTGMHPSQQHQFRRSIATLISLFFFFWFLVSRGPLPFLSSCSIPYPSSSSCGVIEFRRRGWVAASFFFLCFPRVAGCFCS